MSAIVAFDSTYGNTAKVAEAIGSAIEGAASVRRFSDVDADALSDVGLLVVGSPTQGGRPTAALNMWLSSLQPLPEVSVAAFDTRVAAEEQNFAVRALIRLIGYSAPRIAASLTERGGRLVAPPEGFFVRGREGPLKEGELERAKRWARSLSV